MINIRNKIASLVKRGYTEAAFSSKRNAMMFANAWRTKGYTIATLKSSGPTVEGGYKENAIYVMARKKTIVRKRKARIVRKKPSMFAPSKNWGI